MHRFLKMIADVCTGSEGDIVRMTKELYTLSYMKKNAEEVVSQSGRACECAATSFTDEVANDL